MDVSSIPEEYRVVAETRCPCGSTSPPELVVQMLAFFLGQPYDVLVVRCPDCGREERKMFGISSFFGRSPGEPWEQPRRD
jgi:hypothetical protein